ncbi:zinc-binding protein A33-like [Hypanus sabinus]|uniref:zinc-binding protein A33-like n=1 Tax=Hypanus sabinus TaxID=79690 RepID=UPI0028C4AD71|nr:zinc-binding protein A33-like [Hypanus sabinus]
MKAYSRLFEPRPFGRIRRSQRKKAALNEIWNTLKERQKAIASAQIKQKLNMAEVEKAFVTEMDQIRLCFAEMTELLRGKVQSLAEGLEEKKQNILKRMELRLEEIQEGLTRIGVDLPKAEEQLQDEDSFQLLQGFSELRCPQDLRPLEYISEDLSLDLPSGLLKYGLWKELGAVISPGSGPLTLNPATASPWLSLSGDLSSTGPRPEKRPLPEDPLRFDPSPCVLALGGFVMGRHYWEVKVGHKISWTVGVASELARRKGSIVLSPTHGYWTLGLRNGVTYKAFTGVSDELHLELQPRVVGVYLDYEGGRVSFYNADGMSHLHTYHDRFSQRLFPFFSPGATLGGRNAEPLRLLLSSTGDPGPRLAGPPEPEREDAILAAPRGDPSDGFPGRRWDWVCSALLISLAAAWPGRADFLEVYLVCCGVLGFSGLWWSLLDNRNLAGISWRFCGVLGHAGLSCFLLASAGLPGTCLVGLSFFGWCLSSRGYTVSSWLAVSFGGFLGLLWLLDNNTWIWWVCCGVLGYAGTFLSLLGCDNVALVCWWCCGTQGYVGLCLLLLCSSPLWGLFWIVSGMVGLRLSRRGSTHSPWALMGLLSYNAVWCVLVGNAELSAMSLGIGTLAWWPCSRPHSS